MLGKAIFQIRLQGIAEVEKVYIMNVIMRPVEKKSDCKGNTTCLMEGGDLKLNIWKKFH
ncbi:hypothetical protein CK203_036663 [Vitis vinifera]|uniref:Uncharacterized protein n=1 Tax=Vitis vinifera TaxID=29760 RepID=A0A438HIP9_VITVI|nr:hypothetical protein CK203_036663 [Vitis vinifera]